MVSIIIRTYNEEKYLDELLCAISTQKYKKYEIILVDSGSTDNTIEIANKHKCKIIRIDKEMFSFGYSLNMGIKKSKGDFCVFVSGHCIPTNDCWLGNLIKPFDDNNVAITYGKQIGKYTTKISEHMIFKRWFPDNDIKIQKTPFCNNANSAIRKNIWENIIKYDENVSGLEDLVFAKFLLKNTNYYLSYVSDSIVYHIHNETYPKIRHRYEREAITYSSIFENEKFTFFDFVNLTIRNIISDIKELIKSKKYKLNFQNINSILRFRYNQFLGTYKGYKINQKNKELRKKFYYPK